MRRGTLTTVVTVSRDLPPFTIIGATDVTEISTRTAPGDAIRRIDEAVGRLSLAALSDGTILRFSCYQPLHRSPPCRCTIEKFSQYQPPVCRR